MATGMSKGRKSQKLFFVIVSKNLQKLMSQINHNFISLVR